MRSGCQAHRPARKAVRTCGHSSMSGVHQPHGAEGRAGAVLRVGGRVVGAGGAGRSTVACVVGDGGAGRSAVSCVGTFESERRHFCCG